MNKIVILYAKKLEVTSAITIPKTTLHKTGLKIRVHRFTSRLPVCRKLIPMAEQQLPQFFI